MELRRYSLFSLFFLAIVATIILLNDLHGNYTLPFFGWTITMPIVAWIVLPAFLIFVASLAHMTYYSMSAYFKEASGKREFDALLDEIAHLILEATNERDYTNRDLAQLARILRAMRLIPKARLISGIKKIDDAVATRLTIDEGGWVDAAKVKLAEGSDLFERNQANRLAGDGTYAETILKKCQQDTPLCRQAHLVYAGYASWERLSKLPQKINRDVAMVILRRIGAPTNALSLDKATISRLADEAKLEKADFMALAKLWLRRLPPEELLETFRLLARNFDAATGALLYLLFEFELLEEAAGLLAQYPTNEFLAYRHFLKVRQEGVTISLEDFFGAYGA
ncbi:MAG: hypothetical protein K6347_02055 [Campylobacterales bacterium]